MIAGENTPNAMVGNSMESVIAPAALLPLLLTNHLWFFNFEYTNQSTTAAAENATTEAMAMLEL